MKNNMQSFCKKKSVRVGAGALALILLAFFFMGGDTSEEIAATTDARTVATLSVADYGAGALGTAVPTVSGQAYLVRAEAGGRVTKIHATGTVAAGAVVAELENSAQRAALTQAQGVYEAALAAAGGNVTGQDRKSTR